MKKAKRNLKLSKFREKYTLLLNHSKNKRNEQIRFKTKTNSKFDLISFLIFKIFFIFLLFYIYILEHKKKFKSNIKKFISNYILHNAYKYIKACLCVIGKNENLYVKEFVTYYKNLGYNHIYIYDNNDVNGERFEDVLDDEIKSNFVTINIIEEKVLCIYKEDCNVWHLDIVMIVIEENMIGYLFLISMNF